jgi:hypothetical protein
MKKTKTALDYTCGVKSIKLKLRLHQAWHATAAKLGVDGTLDLQPSRFVHIQPTASPSELALQFIESANHDGRDSNSCSLGNADGLLLFSSTALITSHTVEDTKRIITALGTHFKAEHIRREASQLLLLAAVLQCKSEEQIPGLADLSATVFGCSVQQAEAALALYLKFVAPWKQLSTLELDECTQHETTIRWLAINHTRTSSFFLLALLPWLCHSGRSAEYSAYKTSLISTPNQFSKAAEAILAFHEQTVNPTLRISRMDFEWLEWIRPGMSLSPRIARVAKHSWIHESATNELRLTVPPGVHNDSDICMQRYLSAIRHARPNGLTSFSEGISFITSIYKGAEWIDSFLKNMVSLDKFDTCELILINANSPQIVHETSSIREFQTTHPNILHIILDTDPGLYNIWNLGALIASSNYLSNANLDDRKARDFIVSHLQSFASADEEISLVSAPCIMCDEKYIGFEKYVESQSAEEQLWYYNSTEYYKYPDFFLDFIDQNRQKRIVWRNIPHCMPVWHRELHQKYGYFNEIRGGPTADLEFWLRCARQGETFRNINTPKGLYYYSNTTTYSARKDHTMQRIAERHVINQESANASYLEDNTYTRP